MGAQLACATFAATTHGEGCSWTLGANRVSSGVELPSEISREVIPALSGKTSPRRFYQLALVMLEVFIKVLESGNIILIDQDSRGFEGLSLLCGEYSRRSSLTLLPFLPKKSTFSAAGQSAVTRSGSVIGGAIIGEERFLRVSAKCLNGVAGRSRCFWIYTVLAQRSLCDSLSWHYAGHTVRGNFNRKCVPRGHVPTGHSPQDMV